MSEKFTVSASTLGTMPRSEMPNLTEREFLQQQADQARGAMAQTAKLVGKNLGRSVDPRIWTKSHPWISLGTAAIAAFAAVSLIPHRQKAPAEKPQEKEEEPARKGFLGGIIGHAFKLGWRWVASAVVSNLASRAAQPEAGEEPAEQQEPTQSAAG